MDDLIRFIGYTFISGITTIFWFCYMHYERKKFLKIINGLIEKDRRRTMPLVQCGKDIRVLNGPARGVEGTVTSIWGSTNFLKATIVDSKGGHYEVDLTDIEVETCKLQPRIVKEHF